MDDPTQVPIKVCEWHHRLPRQFHRGVVSPKRGVALLKLQAASSP